MKEGSIEKKIVDTFFRKGELVSIDVNQDYTFKGFGVILGYDSHRHLINLYIIGRMYRANFKFHKVISEFRSLKLTDIFFSNIELKKLS